MKSILQEIDTLRNGNPYVLDRMNRNRYRLVANEKDGSQTAYYFSVPIYNEDTRKLVDLHFRNDAGKATLIGCNASITVDRDIAFVHRDDTCRLVLTSEFRITEESVVYPDMEVSPTINGVLLQADLMGKGYRKFIFETQRPFYRVRSNNKYFAIMNDDFTPLVTVSCVGALDQAGFVCAPVEVRFQKINDWCYELTFFSNHPNTKKIMFEINMQAEKLFQDTTVESKHPDENNVFGGTAYIGCSNAYGNQWLYARPDYGIMNDLFRKKIKRAVMNIPILNDSHSRLSAVGLAARFCSFGSSWRNKKSGLRLSHQSKIISQYHKIDVTDFIVKDQKLLTQSEGWIIKNAVTHSGISVVSTGDSFYAPQILEISFRN